jgi:hypothetical protein
VSRLLGVDDLPQDLRDLVAWLRSKRRHVLSALDGVPDAELRRGMLPSGWTPLGLVQHLALDVERFWFRAVLAGEDVELPVKDEGWTVPANADASAVLDLYRSEAELADAALVAVGDAGAAPRWWPADFGAPPYATAREIVLHVLVETATHAGHLDAARELIDGHQRLVLTD